jgi:hypothetical protein
MASIAKALRELLLADGGVSGVVSARIYRGVAPANAGLPRITLYVVSQVDFNLLSGSASGYMTASVQVDSWGETPDSALSAADAVRLAVHGYIGSMGDDSVRVQHATVSDSRETQIEPDTSNDIYLHRVSQDIDFTFQQTIPSLPA